MTKCFTDYVMLSHQHYGVIILKPNEKWMKIKAISASNISCHIQRWWCLLHGQLLMMCQSFALPQMYQRVWECVSVCFAPLPCTTHSPPLTITWLLGQLHKQFSFEAFEKCRKTKTTNGGRDKGSKMQVKWQKQPIFWNNMTYQQEKSRRPNMKPIQPMMVEEIAKRGTNRWILKKEQFVKDIFYFTKAFKGVYYLSNYHLSTEWMPFGRRRSVWP